MKKQNFRVIPGLSITARELSKRLGSQTLKVSDEGKSYSVDRSVVDVMRMDRTELFRSHLEGKQKIEQLRKQAINDAKTTEQAKKAAELARIKAEALEQARQELAKGGKNG